MSVTAAARALIRVLGFIQLAEAFSITLDIPHIERNITYWSKYAKDPMVIAGNKMDMVILLGQVAIHALLGLVLIVYANRILRWLSS